MAQTSIQLGPIGIWTRQLEDQPAAKAWEAARELEELGYGALWFGEALGREVLTNAAMLLGATKSMVIATGIANIYARDAVAMSSGQKTLAEAFPNRFLLGLGVSHIPLVEKMRGHRYEKPVATMRAYLDAMDQATYAAVPPATKPARVLAALGPKMMELSGERAEGAHPYNVNPEHTAEARKILGPKPYLCPEQAVVMETDAEKARGIGRAFLGFYLTLPNYANNLLRLGFTEGDFKDGGSNKLIDAMVAWGDLNAIRKRIHEHHAAGADHVCIQVLTADPKALPMREWRELAPALLTK
ncbi:MAG TPA: LLM class F420-dependent oxidoreductase [Bryobacteraceae bacterium]|nr:LLM class F420-dependent oxidoreductase [Bryobacteraceae bacterium]